FHTSKAEPPQKLRLDTSPLEWSVTDVVRFIRTTDCAPLARIFMDQEIDGQALLLLNLPTVQECMDLKLGPAIKLCHHIERVKLAQVLSSTVSQY
uniref:SAM domain-containing protein n=1 Tax=Hippocampus comes TaxID=109280 RepID=A0A3Q2XRF9_HIPCM